MSGFLFFLAGVIVGGCIRLVGTDGRVKWPLVEWGRHDEPELKRVVIINPHGYVLADVGARELLAITRIWECEFPPGTGVFRLGRGWSS